MLTAGMNGVNVVLDSPPRLWGEMGHAWRAVVFSLRSLQVFLVLPLWTKPMMMLRCVTKSARWSIGMWLAWFS